MVHLYLSRFARFDAYISPFAVTIHGIFYHSLIHLNLPGGLNDLNQQQWIATAVIAIIILVWIANSLYFTKKQKYKTYFCIRLLLHFFIIGCYTYLGDVLIIPYTLAFDIANRARAVLFFLILSLGINSLMEWIEMENYNYLKENKMDRIYRQKHWNLFGFPVKILLFAQVLCTIRYILLLKESITKYWDTLSVNSGFLFLPTLIVQLTLSLQGVLLLIALIQKSSRLLKKYYYCKMIGFYLFLIFINALRAAERRNENSVSDRKLNFSVDVLKFVMAGAMELFELAQVLRFSSFLILESEMPIGDYAFTLQQCKLKEDFFSSHFDKSAKRFLNSVRISTKRIQVEFITLGEGQFGKVCKGSLRIFPVWKRIPIAIKIIKNLNEADFEAVITELKILSFVSSRNENLVGFFGCCNLSESHFGIILEYVGGGNLKDHLFNLKKSSNWNQQGSFIIWSIQIANGMEFLSGKKIIHGDLATRNILLTEDLKCKISDFGMAFKLHQYQNYARSNQTVLPFRWMAPESLSDFKFSTKSDVWSYAVLVWEIYSLGNQPWGEIRSWSSDFLKDLKNGMILQKPYLIDDILYDKILLKCWALEPEIRPVFKDIKIFLENMNTKLSF